MAIYVSAATSLPQVEPLGGVVPGALGGTHWGTRNEFEERIKAHMWARGIAFLPHVDTLTDETEEMRAAYRKMLNCCIVKAAFLGKILQVCSLDLRVQSASDSPRDKSIADFVFYALHRTKGGIRHVLESILFSGLIDGWSVCEKTLKVCQRGPWVGKWIPHYLKAKDHVRLAVDAFRNVVALKSVLNQSEVYDPSGFVVFKHLSIFENPAGTSDFRAIYGEYWKWDTAEKLRAIHLDKFASPMMKGEYNDDAQRPELELALQNSRARSWIAIPEGAKVEAMNLAASGADVYNSAIQDYKQNIYLGISGASLQALQGNIPDARGDTKVHKSTAELFVWYLASLASGCINDQQVPELVDMNFSGTPDYPEVVLESVSDSALMASAQLDELLIRNGMTLSKRERYAYYGRSAPIDDEDVLGKKEPPSLGQAPAPSIPIASDGIS